MLMLKTTHDRIVAAKDLEIAELAYQLKDADRHMSNADAARDYWKGCVTEWRDACLDAEQRLAVFTTPRARNSRGRFISAKGASA